MRVHPTLLDDSSYHCNWLAKAWSASQGDENIHFWARGQRGRSDPITANNSATFENLVAFKKL
jgi:hypothetical protein